MLPERFFHPLDLNEALDEAYGDDGDSADVRAVIEEALFDPRAQGDERVFGYAWECLEFYDDDELPAAADWLAKVIEAHPGQRFALGALRATLRGQEDRATTLEEITALHQELVLLPPDQRDLRFYYFAPSALAEATQDEERGGALADEGIELAESLDRGPDAGQITERSPAERHKRMAVEAYKSQMDDLLAHLQSTRHGHALGASARGKRALAPGTAVMRVAYLPEREYTRGVAESLLDATFPLEHEDHRRELQDSLRTNAELGKVFVVTLSVEGIRAYAEETGEDPARRSTRLAYVGTVDTRDDVAWPPERNAPCWCGSTRKYKKCCGRPGFGAESVPDRGQAVLRVELPGTDPLVTRRLAVPSRIRLDDLHKAIGAAMGWHGDHMYAFEIQGGRVVDPRSDDDCPTTDETSLPQLANEPGQEFVYRYDFGDDWEHKVTVEGINAVDPAANGVRLLGGEGACPPEDCGGVYRYRELVAALADHTHPAHDEAMEWLGEEWDAAAIRVAG
ncbi:SEC-C metal-binding domain-containing protein [Microbispora sp. NBC_01189]|uniref:IS1096 element passenger TnpR family protein n=1 Tax=Microbispora sp. NBC_01189 TaxID=2903583 RepID=UPI002E151E05|nr:SEC-C metal-binding domain-containing protein [Microbispora sp. NBC_01189]